MSLQSNEGKRLVGCRLVPLDICAGVSDLFLDIRCHAMDCVFAH